MCNTPPTIFNRDNSSLEKVFDYFSNKGNGVNGSRQMDPHALLNAIVPTYPPSKSNTDRAGSLAGDDFAWRMKGWLDFF